MTGVSCKLKTAIGTEGAKNTAWWAKRAERMVMLTVAPSRRVTLGDAACYAQLAVKNLTVN
jgi:hypothetical protein